MSLSPKAALEIEKLEAEILVLRSEAEKLKQEASILKKPKWRQPGWWRDLVGIPLAIGTLAISSLVFFFQQREKHQFEVNREVITLVDKIRTGDPREQEHASILLSVYGEQVLPVLLSSVAFAEPPLSSAYATALTLIGAENPEIVLEPVRGRAGGLLHGVIRGNKEAVDPLINFTVLTGQLADLGGRDSSESLLRSMSEELDCPDGPWSDDDKTDRIALCTHIEAGITVLQAAGG